MSISRGLDKDAAHIYNGLLLIMLNEVSYTGEDIYIYMILLIYIESKKKV